MRPPSSTRAGALAAGLYERLLTRALRAELDAIMSEGTVVARTKPIDPAEGHLTLARHIERVVAGALRGLPTAGRETHQAEVANRTLALLAGEADLQGAIEADDAVALPPEELLAVRAVTGDPARDRELPRPKGRHTSPQSEGS